MKRFQNFKALARALMAVAAVAIIVTGVTFAALQSQQDTLTGNSIETQTADMVVSNDGRTFSNSQPGFDFPGLIPGAGAVPQAGFLFYLQNRGETKLAPRLSIVNSININNANLVDLSKVHVLITTVGSSTSPQSFSLQSLIDSADSGGLGVTDSILDPGQTQQYKIQIAMDADAFSGPGATLQNLNLAFTGLAE